MLSLRDRIVWIEQTYQSYPYGHWGDVVGAALVIAYQATYSRFEMGCHSFLGLGTVDATSVERA